MNYVDVEIDLCINNYAKQYFVNTIVLLFLKMQKQKLNFEVSWKNSVTFLKNSTANPNVCDDNL